MAEREESGKSQGTPTARGSESRGGAAKANSVGRLGAALRGKHLLPGVCLAIMLACGLWPNGFFETARNWLFDAYQRLSPADRPTGQTVVIDIDTASVRRVGQWPWSRAELARLVDAAAAARVIGLDLVLAEPDRMSPQLWIAGHPGLDATVRQTIGSLPSTDDALARSLSRVPVVMSALATTGPPTAARPFTPTTPIVESGESPRAALPRFDGMILPLPAFTAAARGIGIVSVPLDADGVMRRVPLLVAIGADLVPAFAAEVLRLAMGAGDIVLAGDRGHARNVVIGNASIPTDAAGRVWLRYAALAPAQVVPAHRILDGAVDPALFRDRVVLIGASAAGLGPLQVTPLRQSTSGIAVQAQLVENLLAQDMLRRPSLILAGEALFAAISGIAAILLLGNLRLRLYGLLFAALALLLIGGSWAVFRLDGLLVDWTYPLATLAATGLIALLLHVRREINVRHQRERELAAALLRAEAADRAKTEFLANMSHELRTPLTAIIGFSELMSGQHLGPLSPVYAGYARDIHASGSHLLSIIESVLDLSVLDLGALQPTDGNIIVAEVLSDSLSMVRTHAAKRSMTLTANVATDLPMLRADLRMVRQMVVNLLANAIKYSPAKGTVTLRAVVDENHLCISVQDTGPGIADSDIPLAMQRFGRLRSARLAQEPGLGIGLPLTRSMIELHGGRVEIRSRLGAGTNVLLWFPPARLVTERSPP